MDHFGTPEQLDQVMDRLYALSTGLLDQDCPHRVQWEEDGAVVRSISVSDREALLACMGEILSAGAPLQGTTMRELLSEEENFRYIYITSREEGAP